MLSPALPLGCNDRSLSRANPAVCGSHHNEGAQDPARMIDGGGWSLKPRGGNTFPGRRGSGSARCPSRALFIEAGKRHTLGMGPCCLSTDDGGEGGRTRAMVITPVTQRARRAEPERCHRDEGPRSSRSPHPPAGSAPRRGHFAGDSGEGEGCQGEASCHLNDRQQLSSRIWNLAQTGGTSPLHRAGAASPALPRQSPRGSAGPLRPRAWSPRPTTPRRTALRSAGAA